MSPRATPRGRALGLDEGAEVTFTPVLLVDGDDRPRRRRPSARRRCRPGWSAQAKGPKITGMTYKNKTNSRRRFGHRQHYDRIEITGITQGLREADMSKTKGAGSTKNGRDSNAQRLGVKVYDGTVVDRRLDHRPPARHPLPPRRERRPGRRRHPVRHSPTAR